MTKSDEFLALSLEEKVKKVNEGVKSDTPFFLERIITTLQTGNTACLCYMPKWVVDCYHQIKQLKQ